MEIDIVYVETSVLGCNLIYMEGESVTNQLGTFFPIINYVISLICRIGRGISFYPNNYLTKVIIHFLMFVLTIHTKYYQGN
jgi:hypothetical protein